MTTSGDPDASAISAVTRDRLLKIGSRIGSSKHEVVKNKMKSRSKLFEECKTEGWPIMQFTERSVGAKLGGGNPSTWSPRILYRATYPTHAVETHVQRYTQFSTAQLRYT